MKVLIRDNEEILDIDSPKKSSNIKEEMMLIDSASNYKYKTVLRNR